MLFDNMYEKIKVNYLEFTGNVEASVAELKNKASEFMALLEWFNEPEQQKTISENPELEAEYRILNTSAFNIQEKINSFTNAFDWVSGKIADTFNFTTNQQVMNGLNVIPFLPVAAIAGALTAITYWLTDAYKLKEKIEHVQEIDLDDLSLLWLMGDVVAIEYLTSRSGVGEYYRHDFSDKAMPALLVTPNGKNVLLVGTDFEVNERGFVDDK